jgi:hypothetical protein
MSGVGVPDVRKACRWLAGDWQASGRLARGSRQAGVQFASRALIADGDGMGMSRQQAAEVSVQRCGMQHGQVVSS